MKNKLVHVLSLWCPSFPFLLLSPPPQSNLSLSPLTKEQMYIHNLVWRCVIRADNMLGAMLCFSQGFCVSVFMFGKIAVLVLIEERSRVTLLVCISLTCNLIRTLLLQVAKLDVKVRVLKWLSSLQVKWRERLTSEARLINNQWTTPLRKEGGSRRYAKSSAVHGAFQPHQLHWCDQEMGTSILYTCKISINIEVLISENSDN